MKTIIVSSNEYEYNQGRDVHCKSLGIVKADKKKIFYFDKYQETEIVNCIKLFGPEKLALLIDNKIPLGSGGV